MDRRLQLQTLLESVMQSRGLSAQNVYFQPGNNISLNYPAIVYQRDYMDTNHADNQPYTVRRRYSVTFIARDPDESVIQDLSLLPRVVYDRFYKADGLNHDVFKIYF